MLSPDAIPMLLAGYVLIGLIALALWPPCKGQPRVVWILVGASLVAVLRLSVPGHGFSWPGTYEALAHVVCGMLLMLAFQKDKLAGWGLAVITVFEGVMFAMR